MAIIASVEKVKNENNMSLIRKFSRKVRATGALQAVRGKRYHKRPGSKLRTRQSTIERIKRGKEFARLRKLGKIS